MSSEVFTKTEIITPEIAEKMLSTIEVERTLRPYIVDQIAGDMTNGYFDYNTGESIKFDANGHLIDGQHRLHAIIQSGISGRFQVSYNASKSHLDRHTKRTLKDCFKMDGSVSSEYCTNSCIAIVNTYLSIIYKFKAKSLSESYKARFLQEHGPLILLSYDISSKGNSKAICRKSGVQAALFGALLSGVDENKLLDFTRCVNSGFINDNSESSAIVLRNFLQENKSNGETNINIQASMAEQAIQDFVKGNPRQKKYTKILHPYIKPEKGDET